MSLRINDEDQIYCPDNLGIINFHEWIGAGGQLFPILRTYPVCTTELGYMTTGTRIQKVNSRLSAYVDPVENHENGPKTRRNIGVCC